MPKDLVLVLVTAGSGEFHLYKASRRREYERLKMLEEATQNVSYEYSWNNLFAILKPPCTLSLSPQETEKAEFGRTLREAEEITNAKTAQNRVKKRKKKS